MVNAINIPSSELADYINTKQPSLWPLTMARKKKDAIDEPNRKTGASEKTNDEGQKKSISSDRDRGVRDTTRAVNR